MIKKIVIAIAALSIPINLILNYLYSQHLYSLGVKFILWMQKYSSLPLDYFFITFTVLVDPVFVIACACLMILFMKRKLTAYVTVIFILFNTYFLTISKSFYGAPRPYWTHKQVRNIGYYCPRDYGNPSGHAQFIAIMVCVLMLEFIDTKKQKIFAFVGAFLMIAVSLSRMYLGGHSLDQVTQGLFLGVSMSILYVYGGIKELICQLIIRQRSKSYKITLFVIILSMHLMYICAYFVNDYKSKHHQKAAKVWVKNYNEKCGKDIDEHYLNFVMLNLNAVLTNVITGLILGFEGNLGLQQINLYLKGSWLLNYQKYPNKLIAYGLFLGTQVGLFIVGLFCFSPILLLQKSNTTHFIYNNLAILTSSYLYSHWNFKIQSKLKLIRLISDESPKTD